MTASTVTTNVSPQHVSSSSGIWDRLRYVGITGIVAGIALSVIGWLQVVSPENNGSVVQAIGILFMTAPVVLARRQPIIAVSIVALAAVVNGLLWDDIVRCGAAIPALVYISFAIGSRSRIGGHGWLRPLLGLAIALGAVVAQVIWDPVLNEDALYFAGALVLLCWGGGLGWSAIESRLSRRTA